MAFEELAAQGRRALTDGDAGEAARILRDALLTWRTGSRPTWPSVREPAWSVSCACCCPPTRWPNVPAQLMRALYAAGRQAEAIVVYHEGRELLADQLGVDPSAHLEHVYLGILRGPAASREQAGAVAERAAVPAQARLSAARAQSPLTSFVGRDKDRSRVLKSLRAARLVTLTGPGGIGKTRLATKASGRLGAAARFLPLAPVTDPADVAYTVLDALGIREPVIARRAAEPGTGPLDRLAAALGDRDEVLILDNCEHVIEAAAALAGHLLAVCPRVRILATSRQPLRIDGETLCPVLPLPIPPVPSAPVMIASYGSARLLRDRAVAVRPDFELGEANAASAVVLPNRLTSAVASIAFAAASYRMNSSWTMPLSERAQEPVSAAQLLCACGQRLPATSGEREPG